MSLRAPKDTAESLRLTLQKLEQAADPAHDAAARAELKRILLMRIADLEALEALKAAAKNDPPPPDLAETPPLPVSPETIAAAEPNDQTLIPPAVPEA